MRNLTKSRAALGTAAALSIALGAASVTPAYAEHGDVAKGLILGIAGGVALDQLANQRQRQRSYVVEQPEHRRVVRQYVYTPQRASPAHQAFNSQDRKMRISIQYQLMQRGLYNASLDGAWGPSTSNALFSYAQRHHKEGMLTTVHGTDRLFSDLLS